MDPDNEPGRVFLFLAPLKSAFTISCPQWVFRLQKKEKKEEQKDVGEEDKSAGQEMQALAQK